MSFKMRESNKSVDVRKGNQSNCTYKQTTRNFTGLSF